MGVIREGKLNSVELNKVVNERWGNKFLPFEVIHTNYVDNLEEAETGELFKVCVSIDPYELHKSKLSVKQITETYAELLMSRMYDKLSEKQGQCKKFISYPTIESIVSPIITGIDISGGDSNHNYETAYYTGDIELNPPQNIYAWMVMHGKFE